MHFYRNMFLVVPGSKVQYVVKMFKAIYAQKSKKASREKGRTVIIELCKDEELSLIHI